MIVFLDIHGGLPGTHAREVMSFYNQLGLNLQRSKNSALVIEQFSHSVTSHGARHGYGATQTRHRMSNVQFIYGAPPTRSPQGVIRAVIFS